jgi:hypothetical protein
MDLIKREHEGGNWFQLAQDRFQYSSNLNQPLWCRLGRTYYSYYERRSCNTHKEFPLPSRRCHCFVPMLSSHKLPFTHTHATICERTSLKNAVFWDVAPCRYFVNLHTLVHRSWISYTLTMEAIRSSETSVNKISTQRHIPEDGILHSHRRENLKSHTWSLFTSTEKKKKKKKRVWCLWTTDKKNVTSHIRGVKSSKQLSSCNVSW